MVNGEWWSPPLGPSTSFYSLFATHYSPPYRAATTIWSFSAARLTPIPQARASRPV